MDRYWERETPVEAQAEKVWVRYFHRAKKFQVGRRYVTEDGEPRIVHITTIDLTDIARYPHVVALFALLAKHAQEQVMK